MWKILFGSDAIPVLSTDYNSSWIGLSSLIRLTDIGVGRDIMGQPDHHHTSLLDRFLFS